MRCAVRSTSLTSRTMEKLTCCQEANGLHQENEAPRAERLLERLEDFGVLHTAITWYCSFFDLTSMFIFVLDLAL